MNHRLSTGFYRALVGFLGRMMRIGHGVLLLVLGICGTVSRSAPTTTATVTNHSASVYPEKAPLKEIAPGLFELGKVKLDKKRKSISFPAVLNMNEALVEYLVVNANGKTHESLLRTEAEPWHIQVAMLLLGAKGAQGRSFPADKTQPLPGETVRIEVQWTVKGETKRFRAEDWIVDVAARKEVAPGHWIYTGSRFESGQFRAQQDGSIIALIEDPDALVSNPRPGRDNDDNWRVKSEGLPPLETPVEVIIQLQP